MVSKVKKRKKKRIGLVPIEEDSSSCVHMGLANGFS